MAFRIFFLNSKENLVYPLFHIFSFSMMTGDVPISWTKSIICPVPKISNPVNPANFRPISLLCSVSKILEQNISQKITKFIELNKIIPECQHCFRKKHSITKPRSRK